MVNKSSRNAGRSSTVAPSVQRVRAMIQGKLEANLERNIYSVTTATTAASPSGTIIPISQGIIQGDDLFQRDGDKITVQTIYVRAQFYLNILQTNATVRYILFYDTTNNGTTPGVTDVIQNPTVVAPHQAQNLLRKRFHFLADHTFPLVLGGRDQVVHKEFSFKKKFPIFYLGTADLAASNGKNALFVLVVTDAGSNFPTYNFTHQIEYYDA